VSNYYEKRVLPPNPRKEIENRSQQKANHAVLRQPKLFGEKETSRGGETRSCNRRRKKRGGLTIVEGGGGEGHRDRRNRRAPQPGPTLHQRNLTHIPIIKEEGGKIYVERRASDLPGRRV